MIPSGDTSDGGRHIASIVHLTDTHLFVDASGAARPSSDRSRLVKALARLGVEDLDFADHDVVAGLAEQLSAAVLLERESVDDHGPVVLVHTGDVEAFGARRGAGRFSGFDHLAGVVAEAGSDGFVAVYGNHDVWPGSVALLGLNGPGHDTQKRTIDRQTSMIGELPPSQPIRFPTVHGNALAFVPINSVFSHPIRGGLLANGRVSPHPPDAGDAIERLRRMHLRPDDLNIAVLHHPLHGARPVTLRDRAGVGRLEQAGVVADELGRLGIDLVLSGHHHRLDPPFGQRVDAGAGMQQPLPAMVAQLVALSPTMHSHPGLVEAESTSAPRRGLCVYRVVVDATGNSISIQRVIHPTDAPRIATFEPSVISGLALGGRRGVASSGALREDRSIG